MQPSSQLPEGLPQPHPDALERSRRTAAHIRDRIGAAGGAISFGEFMQEALYAPALGYYVAGAAKFGADGDFVTAPEVSPLFGSVVARQCGPVIDALGSADILEVGAGSGALAVSMLKRLAELGSLPRRYRILEVSPDLVQRQKEFIHTELGELARCVEWLSALPDAFDGVIVANEVLDALPVERFRRDDGLVSQQYIEVSNDDFRAVWRPADRAVALAVDDIETSLSARLASGYRSEVSLGMAGWLGDLLGALEQRPVCLLYSTMASRAANITPTIRDQGWLRCHFPPPRAQCNAAGLCRASRTSRAGWISPRLRARVPTQARGLVVL